jgi:hypothetical protein
MPYLTIDNFDLPAPWQALTPALTPSAEIVLAADGSGHPFATAPASLLATIGSAASGHRLRRAIAATNLDAFARLDFWFRSDRPLLGLPDDALRVRLRLGSAALTLDAPGNLWSRFLVGQAATGWSFAAISLSDLAPAIRAAVTQIEFVVDVTDGQPHRLWLDELTGAAPRMTEDVDQALMNWLDGTFVLGGSPVPARLAPGATAQPYIRATQFGARRAFDRDPMGFRRQERDDLGVLSWPAPEAWDLSYRFDPVAGARSQLAAMLDFLEGRLGTGWLPVGNRAFRIAKSDAPVLGDESLPLPPLRYVVSAWAETGQPRREVPVTTTQTSLDVQPAGA